MINLLNKRNVFNKNVFNKEMNYYVCSYGGCGSTILCNYLSQFGNVKHIHDRYPPEELRFVGNEKNSEWFNNEKIPEDKLKNYKVIFIYRNPIDVIFSRFAQKNGPNINHLKNIMCDNNGNINFYDVIKMKKDLYKIEDFFDNYIIPKNRNYKIVAIKYELFFENICLFNKIMNIPDVKELYPIKQERRKKMINLKELLLIYSSLINKMNSLKFIEIIN